MPIIRTKKLYDLFYSTAAAIFKQLPAASKSFEIEMIDGTALYRYVGYRNGLPQIEDAARKIWTPLQDDTNNRWTGSDLAGQGQQGLYLSLDAPGPVNTSFPELVHYQDSSVPANEKVSYFEYQANTTSVWTVCKASELRSMFLFTLDGPLKGLDLSYSDDVNSPVQLVFGQALKLEPDLIPADATAKKLYHDPDDASFTRALGNAALAEAPYQYILTTSVRDLESANVVLAGVAGQTLDILIPQGRATFFIDGSTRQTKPVFTIDDLVYNDEFDTTGGGIIPSAEVLSSDLAPFTAAAVAIDQCLPWDLAREEVTSFINGRVSVALQQMTDPYATSVDQLVDAIADDKLDGAVRVMLTDYAVAAGPIYEDYGQLVDTLGAEGVRTLLSVQVVDPVFDKMTDTSGGSSYIELSVRQAVLAEQAHYLNQHASEIERKIAASAKVATATSEELAAQRDALQEVEQKLESQPNDPDLLQQRDDLAKQIEELDKLQKRAEEDKANAEDEQNQLEQAMEDNKSDSESTDQALDAAGQEIFHD